MRSGNAKVCPQCGEIKPISDFKDSSLLTGVGRFCVDCKIKPTSWEYVSTANVHRATIESKLLKSDINKLLFFSKEAEKYATGTSKSREKVEYLENIKHKFSETQLATYIEARGRYYVALAALATAPKAQKKDYGDTLAEALKSQRSVKIRYKGSWRTIDPYSLNTTYVVAYCHFARDIRTFRIDRIQGAELSEGFILDKSLQATAQPKLTQAPAYKYTRRRRG